MGYNSAICRRRSRDPRLFSPSGVLYHTSWRRSTDPLTLRWYLHRNCNLEESQAEESQLELVVVQLPEKRT